MPRPIQDITGSAFGKLVVTGFSHAKSKKSYWFCRCECGNDTVVRKDFLADGHTQSCGCLRRGIVSEISRAHGMEMGRKRREPEYNIWRSMMSRCFNKNHEYYDDYGGRGILVSEEWRCYENFYKDMGSRPGKDYSIDRIDNDLGYSKENCRWTTRSVQAKNTRRNMWVDTPDGPMILVEAERKYGMCRKTIKKRIALGMEMSSIFSPVEPKGRAR